MKVRTFRLDVGSRGEDFVAEQISTWLAKNSDIILKYAIAYEIAEKTKKPHYQGIMYVDEKSKFENIVRYWKDWKSSEKSFAPVRDEKSYRMYIRKDGDMRFVKGITEEDMESWGEWEKKTVTQKKDSKRVDMYARFLKHCKDQEAPPSYTLAWIASELFDFIGYEPCPEQVNWFKGMVFSAQTVLMKNHPDHNRKVAVRHEWIERILY